MTPNEKSTIICNAAGSTLPADVAVYTYDTIEFLLDQNLLYPRNRDLDRLHDLREQLKLQTWEAP